MGDFTQPQQKFAATGENCDFVIAVNFYPGLGEITYMSYKLPPDTLYIFFSFIFSDSAVLKLTLYLTPSTYPGGLLIP